MARAAVLAGPERRRRWSSAEKDQIVGESLATDATVVEIARRHDIHPNLLHLWRRQARSGAVGPVSRPSDTPGNNVRFTPVAIAPDERASAAPHGMIEIEFASGTRLRISGLVDAATVSAAIAAVARGERPR
jgi:transposase